MFEIWSWWCKYLSSFYFVNITFLVSHISDLGRDKRDAWEPIDYDCEFSIWIRLILTWCRCNIAGWAVSSSPSMCQKQSHERAKRQGILLSIPLKFSWGHVTPEMRFGLLACRQFRDGGSSGIFFDLKLNFHWKKEWTKSWEPMHKKNEGLTKQHCDKQ